VLLKPGVGNGWEVPLGDMGSFVLGGEIAKFAEGTVVMHINMDKQRLNF
jgi:hypothetical protein